MACKPDGCVGCLGLAWGKHEFVPPSGSGDNGVLILGEAAGESEALEGKGFVGRAGMYLFQNLQRAGIEREGFRIDNALHCRPPKNYLAGAPYEGTVLARCEPFLSNTIKEHKEHARAVGKTPVILTLGKTAFKAAMGFDDKTPQLKYDYIAYPFFSDLYKTWVVPAYHPSYLMRGNTHLMPVLQFAATRALEIANGDFSFVSPSYLLDPNASVFADWLKDYIKEAERDPSLILSYDIETPMKQGNDEEDVAKEDDDDYTILRCSFSYAPNSGVSVKWDAEMRAGLEEIFAFPGTKCGWNNEKYDRPRIIHQMPIKGDDLDGMLMWHVLNSSLPKGLGFVAPYYAQRQGVWKYTSDVAPALYNAIDADVALQCVLGIKRDLMENKLWPVFSRHVVEVHKVFSYMSERGVLIDKELRAEAEVKLTTIMQEIEDKMKDAVPDEARKVKIYKKKPKKDEGIFELVKDLPVKYCGVCGLLKPTMVHRRLCKEMKVIELLEAQTVFGRFEEFKVSKLGLMNYQKSLRHQAIRSRKEGKVTFDEKAILQLVKKYPSDPLYPLILQHRGTQKLLSTYVGVTQQTGIIKGGLPTGPDGRVHATFTSNPSTLRSACQKPPLQQQPRGNKKDKDDPVNIIRNLFVAAPGHILGARDYSGIEARLVGYFAGAPNYIRLTGLDVHSFYTAYAINALDGRIKTYDLPQLSWDDDRLRDHLAAIKKEFSNDRNNLYKHLVHAINFGQSPRGAQEKILQETGINFPVATIRRVMDLYKELFPEIPKWHWNMLLQVEKEGYLRNPFGYVHRFTRPFEYEKFGREWQKKQGVDANKIWAFLPQSTAAGIIKEAMMRLHNERFEEAGQYLRLLIHDELFWECPQELQNAVDAIVTEEMEKPILTMPLPASYGMGPFLNVGTEGKCGMRWGGMK